jgi:hypothetical protein
MIVELIPKQNNLNNCDAVNMYVILSDTSKSSYQKEKHQKSFGTSDMGASSQSGGKLDFQLLNLASPVRITRLSQMLESI